MGGALDAHTNCEVEYDWKVHASAHPDKGRTGQRARSLEPGKECLTYAYGTLNKQGSSALATREVKPDKITHKTGLKHADFQRSDA
jgi:hypothetical protein